MNDDFGVGMRVELVAALFKPTPQFWKIVDFAVVDDPDAFVFVVDGLVATGQVNNA